MCSCATFINIYFKLIIFLKLFVLASQYDVTIICLIRDCLQNSFARGYWNRYAAKVYTGGKSFMAKQNSRPQLGPNSAHGLRCHQPGVAALGGAERLQVCSPEWLRANLDPQFELSPNCYVQTVSNPQTVLFVEHLKGKKSLINK